MQNKSLLFGISGFILGGLVVAIAATTFDKPSNTQTNNSNMSNMTMSEMTSSLEGKSGDDYDKAFIENMIAHHQSAVDMAKLSASRAKHDEIKTLSNDIIAAQEKEISEMKMWQTDWNYTSSGMEGMNHSMPGMSH